VHGNLRVDRPQALGHHFDLGPPDLAFQRMGLAVGIADADIVQVEQGDFANATARQGLGRPRADPADADHCHMGIAQALQALVAIQPGNAGKAWILSAHVPTSTLVPENAARIIGQRPLGPPSLGNTLPLLL